MRKIDRMSEKIAGGIEVSPLSYFAVSVIPAILFLL